MADLLKKWSLAVISVLILTLILINFAGCKKSDGLTVVKEFFEARKSGDFATAYEMISDESRNLFSKEQFENYCFVFRVMEFNVTQENTGYYAVNYTYYDKKFNRETKELYTYYINKNVETLKIKDGRIIFPHTGFILVRKFIEEKNPEEVEEIFNKMLSIDKNNPDVLKSASLMGFNMENKK